MDNKQRFKIAIELKQPNSNISEIARKYNISRSGVKYMLKYFKIDYGNNFEIQHQMFLGSKLGDGYFQKIETDSRNLYKYRESHSIDELEYASWKYLILDSFSTGTSIIDKNNGTAVEIYTNNKSSYIIKDYYKLNIDEVINEINIYGLLVWILDDGWYSNHSKQGNIVIGSKILTLDQKRKIKDKFSNYNIECNLIGKRNDISIDAQNNFILLAYLEKMMFTMDLDIIHKKFGKIYSQI